jgi:DHA1 family inner membrane transport protein
MLVGRVVAACADGAFFGIDSVVAADLVPPHKKASAILMMFADLTVNVVGVPLGAYVGQSVGWRVTFLIIAAIGLLGLAGIVKLAPDIPNPGGVNLRNELSVCSVMPRSSQPSR